MSRGPYAPAELLSASAASWDALAAGDSRLDAEIHEQVARGLHLVDPPDRMPLGCPRAAGGGTALMISAISRPATRRARPPAPPRGSRSPGPCQALHEHRAQSFISAASPARSETTSTGIPREARSARRMPSRPPGCQCRRADPADGCRAAPCPRSAPDSSTTAAARA